MEHFGAVEAGNNDPPAVDPFLFRKNEELLAVDPGHLQVDDQQRDFLAQDSQAFDGIGVSFNSDSVAETFLKKLDHFLAEHLVIIDNDNKLRVLGAHKLIVPSKNGVVGSAGILAPAAMPVL